MRLLGSDSYDSQGPPSLPLIAEPRNLRKHFYWNNLTIHSEMSEISENCTSCSYWDLPTGGPWPRISCDQMTPSRSAPAPAREHAHGRPRGVGLLGVAGVWFV